MELWRQELYHHGILGMKWGVRRYRNKDGSLTSAGKKRYRAKGNEANGSEQSGTNKGKKKRNGKAIAKKTAEVAAGTAATAAAVSAGVYAVNRYRKGNHDSANHKPTGKKSNKTPVGSMSDEELTKQVKRMTMEKQYNKLSKEAAGSQSSKLERSKKLVDLSSNIVNQASRMNREAINNSRKKEPLDLSSMSDQQLRERINRANLERQYNDLFGKEVNTVSKGRHYTQNILEAGGSVLAIGSSALGIALAIKELRGH